MKTLALSRAFTLHAVGGGRCIVDGKTVSRRGKMKAKLPPGV